MREMLPRYRISNMRVRLRMVGLFIGLPVALALGGCVGSLAGMSLQHAVINRYNDIPYDPARRGDTRYQDYTACIEQDNTSWTVIDACMLRKGYTVKGKGQPSPTAQPVQPAQPPTVQPAAPPTVQPVSPWVQVPTVQPDGSPLPTPVERTRIRLQNCGANPNSAYIREDGSWRIPGNGNTVELREIVRCMGGKMQ